MFATEGSDRLRTSRSIGSFRTGALVVPTGTDVAKPRPPPAREYPLLFSQNPKESARKGRGNDSRGSPGMVEV
jgi:hypothetical protein